MRGRRWWTAALLLLGVAFALLGQYYLSFRREFYRDGILFYAIALMMFGFVLWRDLSLPTLRRGKRGSRQARLRTVAGVGGATLSALAGWSASRLSPDKDFAGPFWLWAIGLVWFLLSFVPSASRHWWRAALEWLRRNRVELLKLAALLGVALVVRAVGVGEIPRNLAGDEGIWGLNALAMFEDGRLANPFSTRWFDFPSMSFLVWGLSMRLFGETIAGLRMVSALIGAASVLTTYLLVRELWGRRLAWLAAAILAFGHFHVHYSRLALNNITDGLFVTLCFWLLMRGLRTGARVTFALAGAAVGLAWYGYVGGRLIVLMMLVVIGVWIVVQRRRPGPIRAGLVVLALAMFVAVAPLLFHYLAHPATFASRYNQVSIFASGWLAREQVITGRSAFSLLLQQVWKSVSAFHYTPDPTFCYRPGVPLLDFVSGVLMLFGLGAATACRRRRADGLLLLWFWMALVFGWVLTENPPSSQRLVIAAPALAILVALGGDWLLRLARRLIGGSSAAWGVVAAGLVGVIAALNLGFYFFDYTPTRVYGNPTAEISDALCDALEERAEAPPIYFDGAPVMYWDFGAIAFRMRDEEGVDFSPETQTWEGEGDRGALFVVLEGRAEDLDWMQERFPGGSLTPHASEADGRLLFWMYEVPPW
jgi:4-amino-4-deoxy-L-arabinose transferase-like glycosyltransferase